MCGRWKSRIMLTLFTFGWLCALPGLMQAESPFVGKWQVNRFTSVRKIPFWIVQIEEKDGRISASVLDKPPPYEVKKVTSKSDGKSVSVTITIEFRMRNYDFTLKAYASKDGKSTDKLYGVQEVRGSNQPASFIKTTANKIDRTKQPEISKAGQLYSSVARSRDNEKKKAVMEEIVKNHGKDPAAYYALLQLIVLEEDKKQAAKYEKQALQFAAAHGPEFVKSTQSQITSIKLMTMRNRYRELLEKDKKAAAKLAKELDAIEEKLVNVEKYQRKGKTNGVVVVELFTGTACPPCVPADMAFDAALKRYSSDMVIFLQYHLHIPRPDPLTTEEVRLRAKYYGTRATPTTFINGKGGPPLGGSISVTQQRYDSLIQSIDPHIERQYPIKMQLTAARAGDKININLMAKNAKPDNLKADAKLRLRFVLVEDVVDYTGRNGQRHHHHVVLGFPGGVEGFKIKKKEFKQSATIDLDKLKAAIQKEFNKYKDNPALQYPAALPQSFKNLKVVALIQEDETKGILHAVQVNVKADKSDSE